MVAERGPLLFPVLSAFAGQFEPPHIVGIEIGGVTDGSVSSGRDLLPSVSAGPILYSQAPLMPTSAM